MKINDWVRMARKSAGLTLAQLGDLLGKTKGNISQWENGKHEPSFHQMKKIAQIANCTLPIPPAMIPPAKEGEWLLPVSYESYLSLDDSIKEAVNALLRAAVRPYPISNDDYSNMNDAYKKAAAFMREDRHIQAQKKRA